MDKGVDNGGLIEAETPPSTHPNVKRGQRLLFVMKKTKFSTQNPLKYAILMLKIN